MNALAQRLEQAWTNRAPVAPLSESDGLTRENAYEVQYAWNAARVAAGELVLGRKIGLTSAAIRAQAGVDEPDYGSLWGSRQYVASGGRAEAPAATFVAPRVEGELAFLLGADLGEGATAQQVLAATEAIAVSVEIIDSRIADWRLTIADTIADNASYGGFVLGPWSRTLRHADLGTLGMVLYRNGQVAATGAGVESFGHPARAVAWLARKLASFGEYLPAGSIVLSGALGRAPDVTRGDEITLRITDNPPLTLRFT
ncbi:2-keto-4-pentenoate hydratase [Amycolatopsis jejuensis]|uniref:2-keto-4-pentenoate hydratase n=1 Tax=Amycolatopsis jejuensis TaxID=330084 RepID=UPI0005252B1E|nr:fumarylacetoacetate hydrolase family protein [Amycolatopsis jejuensis]